MVNAPRSVQVTQTNVKSKQRLIIVFMFLLFHVIRSRNPKIAIHWG